MSSRRVVQHFDRSAAESVCAPFESVCLLTSMFGCPPEQFVQAKFCRCESILPCITSSSLSNAACFVALASIPWFFFLFIFSFFFLHFVFLLFLFFLRSFFCSFFCVDFPARSARWAQGVDGRALPGAVLLWAVLAEHHLQDRQTFRP